MEPEPAIPVKPKRKLVAAQFGAAATFYAVILSGGFAESKNL
jgi:hypothetical protein